MGLEPYEMPAVMACCDPDRVEEDELLLYGASDLVEQVCASIPARIRTLIDDGALDGAKKQARSLANWIANHPNECYTALYKRSGVPGQLEPASWLVNDGKNADWSLLDKFRIRIDFAEITGATVPADPDDHIECLDTGFNKGQVFEFPERPASGLDVARLAEVGGPVQITAVAVPGVEGGVWGGAELGPRGQCTAPWCSVVFSGVEPDGTWTLGELELYAAGPSTIVAGDLSVVVERAAVRLYGESKGQRRVGDSTDTYVIAPGEAEFVISGEVGTIVGTRWATNASPLVGHRTGTEWTIDEFVIEHIQRNGEIWSVTIPQTTWK